MSTNYEKHFTTGEFAKICNIEKHVLFHYDKIGLFCPSIVEDNKYRYYSFSQYETFSMISILKNLGMSLADIKVYLKNRSPSLLLTLLEQKNKDISKEIQKLQQTKEFINSIYETTSLAMTVNTTEISLQYFPEEWILCSEDTNSSTEKHFNNYREEFLNFYKNSYLSIEDPVGSIIAIDSIKNNDFDNFQSLYTKTKKRKGKNVRLLKAGEYLVGYHQGYHDEMKVTLQRMLIYAKEHQITLGPFAYEEYIIADIAAVEEKNYITKIHMDVIKK